MQFSEYDFIDSKSFAGKIILTSFPGLNQNGILIASGILSKNIEETLEKLQKAGFKLLSQTVEEEWECLVLN